MNDAKESKGRVEITARYSSYFGRVGTVTQRLRDGDIRVRFADDGPDDLRFTPSEFKELAK